MDRRDVLALPAALALVVLASCRGGDQPRNQAKGGTAMDNATISKISVSSDAFRKREGS